MLTSWKQTRTSIEYSASQISKKKKKNRKSSSASAASDISPLIGAQFILQSSDSKSNSRGSNGKRRKFNNEKSTDRNGGGALTDGNMADPILCITSPHRAVFMESSSDGTLTESKLRNYVTRPGSSSSFSLNQRSNSSLSPSGMLHSGVKYDSASNLIYALRNGGKELAIWTAASSSAVAGPDDNSSKGGKGKELVNGKSSHSPTRKRGLSDASSAVGDSITSQCLQLPEGKVAVTLEAFAVLSSSSKSGKKKGQQSYAAVGSAGCCEDGSIWVAIRSLSDSQFHLLVVEGSSTSSDGAKPGKKSSTKKQKKAIANDSGAAVLESRTTEISVVDGHIHLSIQSVMLSKDRTVTFRSHQLQISHNGEDRIDATIEGYAKEDIMQLESTSNVVVNLDALDDLLTIVHQNEGQWDLTSVNVTSKSRQGSALIKSTSSFPIPCHMSDVASASSQVFSLGKVDRNAVAILMKSQGDSAQPLLTLRIIDFRRRAELSSLRWIEGEDSEMDGAGANQMFKSKTCHGMITNEFDGSIALLMTSQGSSLMEVLYSRLGAGIQDTAAMQRSGGSTLASALRFVATSNPESMEVEISASQRDARTVNVSSLANAIAQGDQRANDHVVADDNVVDKACEFLATSALLIEFAAADTAQEYGLTITNGKSVSNGKNGGHDCENLSWRDVYDEGCAMIAIKEGDQPKEKETQLINGAKVPMLDVIQTAIDIPRRFEEAAFKETASLLLALRAGAVGGMSKKVQQLQGEATSILVEVLQTGLISAREDYGLAEFIAGGNVLPLLLQASSGKLHVADAMLEHIHDIPEGALVLLLRFVLRSISAEDAAVYYSSANTSKRGALLSEQYAEELKADEATGEEVNDKLQVLGMKLLSQALLDFTSKIVTYSSCNHTFLTKSLRDSISGGEVETILLTLAKLLKSRSTDSSVANDVSLTSGVIHWTSAVTDAHMGTILKSANDGGGALVVERIQRAVRSAMAQSELGNEIQEISDLLSASSDEAPADREHKTNNSVAHQSSARDLAIMPYSVERLTF